MGRPHYYTFEILSNDNQLLRVVHVLSDNDLKSHKLMHRFIKENYKGSSVDEQNYNFVGDWWY